MEYTSQNNHIHFNNALSKSNKLFQLLNTLLCTTTIINLLPLLLLFYYDTGLNHLV